MTRLLPSLAAAGARRDRLHAGGEARLVGARVGLPGRHDLQQHLVAADAARIGGRLAAAGERQTKECK
jgi:hypothetical protein